MAWEREGGIFFFYKESRSKLKKFWGGGRGDRVSDVFFLLGIQI